MYKKALFLLVLPLLLLPVNVMATGTVTLASNVTVDNAYGKLVSSRNMNMGWFAVYSNGTIYFNVAGYESAQRLYTFQLTTFSNSSTLVLRFAGRIPVRVTIAPSVGASSSYNSNAGWEQIGFSNTAASDPNFMVVYAGVAEQIDAAIVIGTAFLIVLVIVIFVGFILMALDWTRRSVEPKEGEIKKIV